MKKRLFKILGVFLLAAFAACGGGGGSGDLYGQLAPGAGPVVFRAAFVSIEPVETVPGNGEALPEDLIIPTGVYDFEGAAFVATVEGLYRFLNPPSGPNFQRIVFDGDIETLLSSLAWIQIHGFFDDGLSPDDMTRAAKTRKLSMSCGSVAAWAVGILQGLGYAARMVSVVTLGEPNGYDDGHIMFETWSEIWNKWVLYDLDNNVRFEAGGVPLSLDDFMEASQTGEYDLVRLASDPRLDVSGLFKDGYDYSLYAEGTQSEATLRAWYGRVVGERG